MGWLADKKGPFEPAILGSLSIAAGCYLISEIRDFNVIVIVYGLLLGALGNAALVAPLLSNTMLWFKERRGIASAVVGAGNALGGRCGHQYYSGGMLSTVSLLAIELSQFSL